MNLFEVVAAVKPPNLEDTLHAHYKPSAATKKVMHLWGNGSDESEDGYDYQNAMKGRAKTHDTEEEADENGGFTDKAIEHGKKILHKAMTPTPIAFTAHHGIARDTRGRLSKRNFELDKVHTAKNYISTSLDEKNAKQHGLDKGTGQHHIIHFSVPKGTHGVYIGKHGNAEEKEFLMPPGTQYKIHKIENKDNETHYHAKVIPRKT